MSERGKSVLNVAAIRDEQGERTRHWMRNSRPGFSARMWAALLGIDERTAKSLLAGHPPSRDIINRFAKLDGWRWVAFVMSPVCGEQVRAEVVAQEVAEAEAKLTEAKAALARLREAGD